MNKLLSFIKEHTKMLAIGSALLAICSFLLPILKVKTTEGEIYYTHLWSYFSGAKYDFTMYITLGLIVLGMVFLLFSSLNKNLSVIASLSFMIAIPFVILSREFYTYNGFDYVKSVSTFVGVPVAIIFIVLALIISISITYQKDMMSVRDIAEEAFLIALAFVLNFIKIDAGSTGGSINLQMLPLFLIALRRGPAHGLVSGGIIYGLLTCLTDGYGFACYPFDYLIGFGSVAIIGLFRNLIFRENDKWYTVHGEIYLFIACLLSTLVRFIGGVMSSMIIYSYDLVASLIYNSVYISVSGAIAMIVIMALLGPITKLNTLFPVKKENE